jgi:ribosomal protein S18 acetylase RimI-like enzyme
MWAVRLVRTRQAPVAIRTGRRDDLDGVLALWALARSPAARTPDDATKVGRLLDHTEDALLVAEADGRIVGALVAAWDGWRGNLYRLAVLPEWRRQGIARALVEAGHERLRLRGCPRVTVLVDDGDETAAQLWRSTGYEHDVHMDRYVRNL